MQDLRALLRAMFDAAIASASPMVRISAVLPPDPAPVKREGGRVTSGPGDL